MLEYEDVIGRQLDELALSKNQVDDVLDYLCAVAVKQDVYYLWRPTLRDPRDDLLLELAVAAGRRDVITFNTRLRRQRAVRRAGTPAT